MTPVGTATRRVTRIAAALLFAGAAPGAFAADAPANAAPAAAQDEPVAWSFVPGRFDLIGRHPDSRRTYTGRATIDRIGQHLRLTREINGRRSTVFGTVRRADPGEVWVLAFAWGTKPALEMVCLVGSDLDNYARLTCHWGRAGNPHKKPGMEAYFAQEPWEPVAD